ncbi:hypothetical protein LCGC14_0483880 [marine sediment metagenome]|uniref:ParB-like N-terminal domain-containing protein n=1 Tax=marine sediment metagenome TaxID=412755 RepID=A0A0F9SRV5_9ZZZZ
MSVENRLRLISTSLIKIPEDRQRKSISEDYLDELGESLLRPAGLLNPIIIRPEESFYVLVIGECRLRAWMKLEAHHESISAKFKKGIPCRFITDLSGDELFDAEFEENYRRKNLSWQDEAVAFLGHYQRQQIKYDEELIEATKENICEDWPDDCPWSIAAGSISISSRIYRRMVMVGRQLLEGDKEVLACDSSRAAGALLDRRIKRVTEIELSTFGEIEEEIDNEVEGEENPDEFDLDVGQLVKPAKKKFFVLNQSFKAFIAEAKDVKDHRRYNFIHCDFPYGKGLHESDLYNTEAKDMSYEDTPDIYWGLCNDLVLAKAAGILSASCHIMFWFPMNFYTETVKFFTKENFRVEPYPLVWIKSDKMGIIPDPARGPRRIYETALIMSLGDRKIIRPTVNGHWSSSGRRSEALHVSSKPAEMLRDFTRMFIDSDSIVLDPTCGSGTALEVALLQHCKFAVGLDISPECVEHSEERAQSAQNLLISGA